MDVIDLHKRIPNKYFDYQKFMAATQGLSHPRRFLGQLLKRGHVTRIKKGLYTWSHEIDFTPLSPELLANLIYGPSYVSLEYALSYYGIIPEKVVTVTSVTFKKNKFFSTPVGNFEYQHIHPKTYVQGFHLHFSNKHAFFIASPEKALLDLMAIRDISDSVIENLRIGPEDFDRLNKSSLKELSKDYKSLAVKKFVTENLHG